MARYWVRCSDRCAQGRPDRRYHRGDGSHPDRDKEVDFTIDYYTGSDAVLVGEGSGITINAADDIAGYKIGVQSGTIHESWVQETLIDTGKASGDHMARYERADQAVLDLKSGRLEVVVMDYRAAKAFVALGGVELALEENLLDESQAIAIPEGDTELKSKMDPIIQELIDDGFVDQLIQDFLIED